MMYTCCSALGLSTQNFKELYVGPIFITTSEQRDQINKMDRKRVEIITEWLIKWRTRETILYEKKEWVHGITSMKYCSFTTQTELHYSTIENQDIVLRMHLNKNPQ